jgi:hypothetical protein
MADAVTPTSGAKIEFLAYADEYTVSGELDLSSGRLQELLERVDELDIERVTVRALDDGREHELPFAFIPREELCVVVASGPRGDPHRRFRTRPYPMRAVIGPYTVIGYLHATPGVDPHAVMHRRQVIAFSSARIAFTVAGERIEVVHDAVLLIQSKLDLLGSAADEDVRHASTGGET